MSIAVKKNNKFTKLYKHCHRFALAKNMAATPPLPCCHPAAASTPPAWLQRGGWGVIATVRSRRRQYAAAMPRLPRPGYSAAAGRHSGAAQPPPSRSQATAQPPPSHRPATAQPPPSRRPAAAQPPPGRRHPAIPTPPTRRRSAAAHPPTSRHPDAAAPPPPIRRPSAAHPPHRRRHPAAAPRPTPHRSPAAAPKPPAWLQRGGRGVVAASHHAAANTRQPRLRRPAAGLVAARW